MEAEYLLDIEGSNSNATFIFPIEVDCNDIHYVNSSDLCTFATTVEDCVEIIEYIDYNYFIFCHFGNEKIIQAIILCASWLFMLFIALGVTSNCFLCPDLFAISKHLGLSENVAGVTLLAFGNGAPDIFSSAAGLQKASAELAIASLIGAGTFVTTVVAGSVFLTKNFSLTTRPFLRDISFYVVAVSWAFALFHFGTYYVFHGIGFVAVYVLYIAVVLSSRYIYVNQMSRNNEKAGKSEPNKLESKSQKYKFPSYLEAKSVVLKAYYFSGLDYWQNDSPPGLIDGSCNGIDNRGFCQSTTSIEKTPKINGSEKIDQKQGRDGTSSDGLWEFLNTICPVNLRKWPGYDLLGKISSIIKSPAVFILKLTVPVVDTTKENGNWCRHLNSLHCVICPLFVVLVSEYSFVMIGGMVPIIFLVASASCIVAVIVFLTTYDSSPPSYHWVFAYIGFIAAVTWIYCLANEIVALLQVFGVIFNLSDAVLGLTVLAWGNSLSDFLSNIAVARKNYPRMGIAACFGGPLLALLLGLGIPMIVEVMKGRAPASQPLMFSGQFTLLFLTLAISLIMTTICSTIWRFETRRWYGILLITLYLLFVTTSILEEFNLFSIM